MIAVHRISQPEHDLYVNPDMIQFVEANPDTVITLTNGTRLVVIETPAEVADGVRCWRTSIIAGAERAPRASVRRAAGGGLAGVIPLPTQHPHAD